MDLLLGFAIEKRMAGTTRRSALVARVVCALVFGVLAIGAGIAIATWSVSLPPGIVPRAVVLVVAPIFAVVGTVVITRVPANPIGHMFLYISVAGAAQLMSEQLAFAAELWPQLAPLAPWAALSYYVIGLVAALAWAPYLVALFPSGHFGTSREKGAVLVATIGFVGMLAAGFLLVEYLPAPFSKYASPLWDPALASFAYALGAAAIVLYGLAMAIVVLGMVGRFRESHGAQRQQLKWFAYAATLTVLTGTAMWLAFFIEYAVIGQAAIDRPGVELHLLVLLSIVAFIVLPVAVAIAILRYRLYEIDILINRTLVYVAVTAILASVFAVLSAAAQRGVETTTGQRSELVTVGTAALVALGFAPLRRRIQPLVDRVLPGRGLLALLMTDIVGSTERVVALGDERWRTVLEAYRAAVRRELARFGGHEVDTAGDGFFATFDHPARAVSCAIALRGSLRTLGLDSRVGLHAGECELRGERVSGINVVVTARIMATAGANEIVTSSALRDLVTTAGFRFRDGRVEALKGVPGVWRLSVLSEEAAAPAR